MRALFTGWGKADFKPAGWIFGTGALFTVLGILALSLPVLSTLAISLSVATLLCVAGSAYLVQSFRLYRGRESAIRLFKSILAIAVGFLIWQYPGGGMLGIALALSVYLFIGGAFQWNQATEMRPAKGWGLRAISALVSFLMGIALLVTFPFSALWMPGALFGIDLIIAGIAMIGLASSERSKKKPQTEKARPEKVVDFYDAA